ncbi:MAG: hypothetical protein R3271_13250 [Methylophaga sp.]|uniref:hypothetical protein n=1 Tax=Methylophaga sp. TaxID=2024840 RepID=UPI00299DBCA4|nr:hypothetical protein [Methylophaga sp.]MDX1751276.1 hypothetical protein [Methylophaga sp.]
MSEIKKIYDDSNVPIPFEFFECEKSHELLVFLPSVRNKDIYPYYPRISWGLEFSKHWNVLYLADPYQNEEAYSEPGGSWYINSEGKSCLSNIASAINELCARFGYKKVLFYGSSMGGYSSIILSLLTSNSIAIAECPQLFLRKHPGSRAVLDSFVSGDVEKYEPMHFLKSYEGNAKIKLVCSLHDRHYAQHVLPFLELLQESNSKNVDVDALIYSRGKYKKGHVALDKNDAYELISNCLS